MATSDKAPKKGKKYTGGAGTGVGRLQKIGKGTKKPGVKKS